MPVIQDLHPQHWISNAPSRRAARLQNSNLTLETSQWAVRLRLENSDSFVNCSRHKPEEPTASKLLRRNLLPLRLLLALDSDLHSSRYPQGDLVRWILRSAPLH